MRPVRAIGPAVWAAWRHGEDLSHRTAKAGMTFSPENTWLLSQRLTSLQTVDHDSARLG